MANLTSSQLYSHSSEQHHQPQENDPNAPLHCLSCNLLIFPLPSKENEENDEEFESKINWKLILMDQIDNDDDELIVQYFEKMIGEGRICKDFKVTCWKCLEEVFNVFGNEIKFLEKSIQIYEKKVEEGKDGDERNLIEKLELEYMELLEEEKTLQLSIEKLQKNQQPNLDAEFVKICQLEEEFYWKENNELLMDIEIDKVLKEERLLLMNRGSISPSFCLIDYSKSTIDGYILSIDRNRSDSQIIHDSNHGWTRCCQMLFSLIKDIQNLPPPLNHYNSDSKANLIFLGEFTQIYYEGKTFDLFLNGNNTSNFNEGVKYFTRILYDLCNHLETHAPEKLFISEHSTFFLEDKTLKVILKCLNFPMMNKSTENWNYAISRILTKLKLLHWYLLQIRNHSLITHSHQNE
ncbi:predicted protein [Naegleria gruberi]|uniref:Predicted protein n=1 Tax=Naegleria gruberi TaxID=5762 RepID=D2V139_NAEGR|nr:uncharacterized protein NAEGRDRAFT_62514 [Naegleria gruberi]EFC49836.1 predicted protein [Naegleria gruberi]|eukprot:XP_002682580.1 predicted protein [Naegleria gruberi strain NEG-M]